MPNAGNPKNTKNSCTINGVLRISSTYVASSARAQRGPATLMLAPAIPTSPPSTVDTAVSPRVTPTPRASMPA